MKTITVKIELTQKLVDMSEVMRNFEIQRALTDKGIPIRGAISIQYPLRGELSIKLVDDGTAVLYTWVGPDDIDFDDMLGESGAIETPVKPDKLVPETPVKPDMPKTPRLPKDVPVRAKALATADDDMLG